MMHRSDQSSEQSREYKELPGSRYHVPGYVRLFHQGLLAERARILEQALSSCALCPRRCGVNRNRGEVGACGVNSLPKVAAVSTHHWEEPPISGKEGSGTIFFSGCTLKCIYCQNYPISQMGVGRYLSVEELAAAMLRLQRRGAHNINLVTATHQMPAVVRALCIAAPQGLNIPLVYNSSGYENTQMLPLLEGIVDIYLPDIKYDDAAAAKWCSQREDYIEHNRAALIEMWRQVGPLQLDEYGVAFRGLLVRHLVLPDNLSGTRNCLSFLANELGPDVWVSLMSQYFPAYKAVDLHPLNRKVTEHEYRDAFQALLDLGLDHGYTQDSCKRGNGTGL